MDIFLYENTLKNFIKLPIVPLDLEVESPQDVETFKSIGQGELKIIGDKGARSFSIETFFPVHEYPFLKDRTYKGMQYVEIIQRWRDSKLPITVIITDLNINFKCAIENFSYRVQDGSGDIYYTLDLSESKDPVIKKVTNVKVSTTSLPTSISNNVIISTTPPSTSASSSKSSSGKKPKGKGKASSKDKKNVDTLKNAYAIVTDKKGGLVRSGAGKSYKKVGTIKYNSKVKLYRITGAWWQVQFGKGTGWINSSYVRRA